jgi:small redox-active disulfide protein 2
MKVQILGTGCAKCQKLAELAQAAIDELGADAEVVKVTDLNDIASFNVLITPALAIDGEVKSAGRLPPLDEIKGWLAPAGS